LSKIKAWINAARLRTLPLSLSGIIVGTGVAGFYGYFDGIICCLALVTTIGFQVTSNFANDYGDGVKGTDNKDRVGPKRAYQSGQLSRKELKKGIWISITMTIAIAASLIYYTFGKENLQYLFLFMVLSALSIWAAIKYTIGDSAYGYRGLGDIFVFLFFGMLSVIGSMFLYTKALHYSAVLPAICIGALSVGVLNLNNLRDVVSDKKVGKNTLIVKMGFSNGKRYHSFLLITSFLSLIAFIGVHRASWLSVLPLVAFVPIFLHLGRVLKISEPVELDPELKKLALSTFLLALLFYFGFNIFL